MADSGYAVGALLAGIVAGSFGMEMAVGCVAALTLLSGIVVFATMTETASLHEATVYPERTQNSYLT